MAAEDREVGLVTTSGVEQGTELPKCANGLPDCDAFQVYDAFQER
jgi:hypothetical protein